VRVDGKLQQGGIGGAFAEYHQGNAKIVLVSCPILLIALARGQFQRLFKGVARARQVADTRSAFPDGKVAGTEIAPRKGLLLWPLCAVEARPGEFQRNGKVERIALRFAALAGLVQQATRRVEQAPRRGGGAQPGDQAFGGGGGVVAQPVLLQGGVEQGIKLGLLRLDGRLQRLGLRGGGVCVVAADQGFGKTVLSRHLVLWRGGEEQGAGDIRRQVQNTGEVADGQGRQRAFAILDLADIALAVFVVEGNLGKRFQRPAFAHARFADVVAKRSQTLGCHNL
jgi:hypothetical protein